MKNRLIKSGLIFTVLSAFGLNVYAAKPVDNQGATLAGGKEPAFFGMPGRNKKVTSNSYETMFLIATAGMPENIKAAKRPAGITHFIKRNGKAYCIYLVVHF